MNNDFVNRPFEEKVAKVKAAPEIAVELLDNQFSLIETMKTQIEVQKSIIDLYKLLYKQKDKEA